MPCNLHALVPHVPRPLSALVLHVSSAFGVEVSHVPCVPHTSSLICLVLYVLTYLTCSRVLRPACVNITFSVLVFQCFTLLFLIHFPLFSGNLTLTNNMMCLNYCIFVEMSLTLILIQDFSGCLSKISFEKISL